MLCTLTDCHMILNTNASHAIDTITVVASTIQIFLLNICLSRLVYTIFRIVDTRDDHVSIYCTALIC